MRRIQTITGENCNVRVHAQDGEFRCRIYLPCGQSIPAADYFTTDRIDAVGTAKIMAAQFQPAKSKAPVLTLQKIGHH